MFMSYTSALRANTCDILATVDDDRGAGQVRFVPDPDWDPFSMTLSVTHNMEECQRGLTEKGPGEVIVKWRPVPPTMSSSPRDGAAAKPK